MAILVSWVNPPTNNRSTFLPSPAVHLVEQTFEVSRINILKIKILCSAPSPADGKIQSVLMYSTSLFRFAA